MFLQCDCKQRNSNRQSHIARTDAALFLRYLLMTGFIAFFVILGSQTARAADRPDSFADLAERLSPAVVNISTTMVVQ